MLDEEEFLSPYGIRAVSKFHREHPTCCTSTGRATASITSRRITHRPVRRELQLARAGVVPVNFLLIESLQKFHYYYGEDFKVECPTGSGRLMTLWDVAAELSRRLTHLFCAAGGRRPVFGENELSRPIRTGGT